MAVLKKIKIKNKLYLHLATTKILEFSSMDQFAATVNLYNNFQRNILLKNSLWKIT